MSLLATILVPLAQRAPNPADVKQGWVGFAMFLFLAVSTFLLWMSFRRQLKKIDFVETDPTSAPRAEAETDPATPSER